MVFTHLSIGACQLTVARPVKTKIQCLRRTCDHFSVGCCYGTPFTGRETFGRMKAQCHRNVTDVTVWCTCDGVKACRSVDDNWNASLPAKGVPRLVRNWPAERRHGDHKADFVYQRMMDEPFGI